MRHAHYHPSLLLILCLCLLSQCNPIAGDSNRVNVVGTMRSVMHGGDLRPTLNLDTLKNKEHLYGVGPLSFLRGEITILDGKSYLSRVASDTTMQVDSSFNATAPFFVFANVTSWREVIVPEGILTDSSIERYLALVTGDRTEPFTFKLSGVVETARIHVVNLPEGAKVANSDDAHLGQQDYILKNQPADVVGFYSTKHQGIFTHHSSNTHMHLITTDKQMMGHVDGVTFQKGVKLWVSSK
jgi:acetolactate decarboxylase